MYIRMYVHPQDPGRLQLMKYSEKLQRSTAKIGAKFIDYVAESGSWVFEVEHFSKYRLLDDDSDDEEEQGGQTKTGAAPKVRSMYVQYTCLCGVVTLGYPVALHMVHTYCTYVTVYVRTYVCTYIASMYCFTQCSKYKTSPFVV